MEEFIGDYFGTWKNEKSGMKIEIFQDGSLNFDNRKSINGQYVEDYYVFCDESNIDNFALLHDKGNLVFVVLGAPAEVQHQNEKLIVLKKN